MTNEKYNPYVLIRRTAHGKPYFDGINGIEEDVEDSPLHDALDFPGKEGIDGLEATLKDRYPSINVSFEESKLDVVSAIRSVERKVGRKEFIEDWLCQLMYASNSRDYDQVKDPFQRSVPVRLSGKDRVRWWSGWFHYQWLIENSRREMEDSAKRLESIFKRDSWFARDVIEEAYFEQVMRERLAIFERRREWWRVIRWGLTTALGMVLAAWSLMQIVDRVIGG